MLAILFVLFLVKVQNIHEFCMFFFADGGIAVCAIVVEVELHNLFGCSSIGVAHAVHRCPNIHALKLILENAAMVVTTNVQQNLPILHAVQIIAPIYSALAHGLLIKIVGGYQFFGSSSGFSSVSGFTTSETWYHFADSSITASVSCLISSGVVSYSISLTLMFCSWSR